VLDLQAAHQEIIAERDALLENLAEVLTYESATNLRVTEIQVNFTIPSHSNPYFWIHLSRAGAKTISDPYRTTQTTLFKISGA